MKRIFFIICMGFLLYPLWSLELEVSGGANFLTFHPDRITPHSVSLEAIKFQAYPFAIGNISLRNEISRIMGFSVNLTRDNILKNSLDGRISAKTDNFGLEIGPFVGMNDKAETPHFGILGKAELTFPGIVFFSVFGSSTLGSSFDWTSDNALLNTEAKLGLWFPFMIPTVSAGFKRFTRQENDTLSIRDSLLRFEFSADIFYKNFPLTFLLNTGYEILTRTYISNNERKDTLNAFFAGLEVSWYVSNPVKIKAGFEIPLYVKPKEPMTAPIFWKMPKLTAGIVYTFY